MLPFIQEMVEADMIWDEYALGDLPPKERLDKCKELIKTSRNAAQRWIAIYSAGEICYEDHYWDKEIGDLMAWVIHHEKNDVVKHEACFQIGLRNFADHIDDLIDVAVHHRQHVISQHEAIEALGLMRAHEDRIIKTLHGLALADSIPVRVSAKFVLQLLSLLKGKGEYRGGKV